jgi:hypothetical protein
MHGRLTWIAVGVVGACYSPRPTQDCEVICSAAGGDRCPDGFACGASGLCSAGGNACQGDLGDAACFGTGIARPCVPAVPPGPLMLSGIIDTDRDARCIHVDQPVQGPTLCVIAGEQIVVSGPVHAVGTRPLVLVASETITVNFMLDARTLRTEAVTGAGASSCPTPTGLGEGGVGAGGAGGSFQESGGAGGAAGGVPATMPATPVAFPDHVRGGCPGGAGGDGTSAVLGRPGAGGGALYLIANDEIDVQAVIAANGAGGFLEQVGADAFGARPGGGGGGGGSGGLIVLEARTITLGSAARLVAVGGGGSGGGGDQSSGFAGGDSDPAGTPITAPGGEGGMANGGNGGTGSPMTSMAGGPGGNGALAGGGGGGGGGPGYIKLLCSTCPPIGAFIIPPRTP